MASFLYYFPGYTGVPDGIDTRFDDELKKVLRDATWGHRGVKRAPDGTSGKMITINPADGKHEPTSAGFSEDPGKQEWHKVHNDEGVVSYWVGFNKDDVPGPADLQRAKPLDGEKVELGDGNNWIVPILHPNFTTLPESFAVGSNGKVFLSKLPGYDEISSQAQEWLDKLSTPGPDGKARYDLGELFLFTVDILNLNYHVGAQEISALRLIVNQERVLHGFIFAALGVTAQKKEIEAQEKKSTHGDGVDPFPGDAA